MEREFHQDVNHVLELFANRQDENLGPVFNFLAKLPSTPSDIGEISIPEMLIRFRSLLACALADDVTSTEALELDWLCCSASHYGLCVLFGALGKATAMPGVFYHDAFYCLTNALLHPDTSVGWKSFTSKARFWSLPEKLHTLNDQTLHKPSSE